METLVEATERAITAAAHLTDKDLGAVEALRVLARKIDTGDEVREAYLEYRVSQGDDISKLRPLQIDNVSIPTYLKFCESLGLTPAGRSKLGEEPKEKPRGRLASIQSAAQQSRTG